MQFPPFLEEDNDTTWDLTSNTGGGSEYGRAVTKLLNVNLKQLLESNDATFYRSFSTNPSLIKFLDTFLRFRSRTIDALWISTATKNDVARSTMVDERKIKSLDNLDRRVFTTFYRLMVTNETNASLGTVLSKHHVIDAPKLLDLCVLYGRKHHNHVRTIVAGAVKVNPHYLASFTQAWAYTTKKLVGSAALVNTEALKATGNGQGNRTTKATAALRRKMRDVLKFVLDMLDTALSVVDTCPDIFRTSCEQPLELLRAIATYLDETLRQLEQIFASLADGGAWDVDTNAIHVVRSLSLRLSHSILNQCLLNPLETHYRRETSHATKSNHVDTAEEEDEELQLLGTGETKNNNNNNASLTTANTSLWAVLNELCSSTTSMTALRILLQTHYNIAGRVQRLIDARVLDHEAFQSFAAVIFEDAPIPMEIMEDEFNQESDIDIVLRESKHKADARITKTRGNAKHQKKDKKGYVENDWMREEDEMYKGMGGGGGSGGSGRRIVDKQLREAMLAIMSKYDDDDDVDDTLDSMTSSLRMRSDISAYSDEEEEQDGAEEDIEILEVSVVNGVRTGVVRNAEGKKVQVLMPNMNRSAKISANSRGRGRKRGGGGGVDTRKCFNCGESGHLSNECPKPRMTGSELGKIKKAKKEQKGKGEAGGGGGKKTNKSKGVSGGGSGNAKGTKASNERQRKRNEKNKSSRANHNRKKGALKKAGKGM